MRYFIFLLFFQLVFHNYSSAQSKTEVKVIDVAQMLAIIEEDTESLHVINFWATWCKPCVAELPYFVDASKDFPKVKFSYISLDFADQLFKVEKFTKKKGMAHGDLFLIDNIDYNSWIDLVSPKWSGAIPFTIIIKEREKYIYEKQFHEGELKALLQRKLK